MLHPAMLWQLSGKGGNGRMGWSGAELDVALICLAETLGCPPHTADWNPQMDLQAQARAHRMGQTREVSRHSGDAAALGPGLLCLPLQLQSVGCCHAEQRPHIASPA